jgi:hypothetical protein
MLSSVTYSGCPPTAAAGVLARPGNAIYRACVKTQSLSQDEVRAAAETHRDLGPDYQPAVIESFLDKVGREIDARVDARVAEQRARRAPRERSAFAVVIASLIFGMPLSAIAVSAGPHPAGLDGLIVVWAAIAVINIAYARHVKPPQDRRR